MFEHIDIVVPPEDEPVTLAQAHAQGRDVPEEDDELLQNLLIAGRERGEAFCRRSFCLQTLDVWYNDPDGVGFFELPRGRVNEIIGIYTYGSYGAETVFDPFLFSLSQTDVVLVDWPRNYRSRRGIKIRIVSGYGGPEDVPAPIKAGILEYAYFMYEHRAGEGPDAKFVVQTQGGAGLPQGVHDLWKPYQIMMV